MKNLILYISFLVFILSGCGASKTVVPAPKKHLPSWYLTPPASDSHTLYGVGEGKDKQEALANALSSMLATLSVSISSDYSAKTVVKEGQNSSVDATYVNDIKSKVQEIRISNYEVVQTQKLGFKHYAVLVKADKRKLFESLKNEIDQKFALLQAREKDLQHQSPLQQLAFYKQVRSSLANLQHTLVVMDVLNPNFNKQIYIQKISALDKKYNALKNAIHFSIKAQKHAEGLANVIAEGLTKEQFHLSNKKDTKHFIVTVSLNVQQANAYGIHLAKAEVTLKTKNEQGEQIASNTLHLMGQSSSSYKIAKQNLAKKLDEKIQEEGIAKVLNLSL